MTLRIGLFTLWDMEEDFGKNILKCILPCFYEDECISINVLNICLLVLIIKNICAII
jgi:hypothetical protein